MEILNPNVSKLDSKQKLDLAKNSLVKEIIKKKEIIKLNDLNKDYSYVDEYLKNLFSKLNYDSENDFKQELLKKNSYSLDQIKQKIKIELMWNELIYKKYKNQVKIDKINLMKRVDSLNSKLQKDYLLSEILFEKKKIKKS